MLISIVICTHNRANYLPKAIQSAIAQNISSDRYEIVVVDNCSTDATKAIVDHFRATKSNIRYIYEPMLGLSSARNTGWQQARGQYIAYLDDDAIACEHWLNTILQVFETVIPQPGCVGGKAEPIWEATRPSWLSDELITCLTVIDWSKEPRILWDLSKQWLVGANIAFPRKVLEQMGGFASGLDRIGNNLLSGGDVFLQKQIMKAGYPCFYHPDIMIQHHIQSSRLKRQWFTRRYYWQGVSDAIADSIEESPSSVASLRSVVRRSLQLLRSPRKIAHLVWPGSDPKQFTQKCFALIEVGHIAGLFNATQR